LRDGASGANLFGWGEHSVEDAITFLELVIIVVVFRVQAQVQKVVIVSGIIPIVSSELTTQMDGVGPSRSCLRIEAASFSFLRTAHSSSRQVRHPVGQHVM
jgi:hypothetical protein